LPLKTPNFVLNVSADNVEKRNREQKEAIERFKIFKYSEDFSFIIDDPEKENCWQMNLMDRKLLNHKEKENLENELSKDLLKASQKRMEYKKLGILQSFNNFNDFNSNF
jgi:hypothetical protein